MNYGQPLVNALYNHKPKKTIPGNQMKVKECKKFVKVTTKAKLSETMAILRERASDEYDNIVDSDDDINLCEAVPKMKRGRLASIVVKAFNKISFKS